jgi:hypothetical protein
MLPLFTFACTLIFLLGGGCRWFFILIVHVDSLDFLLEIISKMCWDITVLYRSIGYRASCRYVSSMMNSFYRIQSKL